ncbi:MAG TPA: hypothetical protein VMW69_00875, partial [Spirochaetia bacterium]|nr:hypothetical protein [Spirochaetia bacterium]
MKSKSVLPAILFALAFSSFASAQQRLVIETGHIGPIYAVAFDNQDGLIFSGGADGTVRAWSSANHELVGVLQIGHLPIRMIAVDPARHEIAAFETDNINTFRIVAWDWENSTQLFSRDLTETPLFMKYSPAGSFLVYGVPAWKSLNFLDSSTGRALPYFDGGIGIVSAAIISDSEKSIMTYSPSGQISYWSVDSGTLKQSYQTLANLSAISFTPNNRYLIGAYNNSLVMVDLVGGQTVSSTPLPNVLNTTVDPSTSEVAAYSTGDNGPELSLYSLSGGLLKMGSAFDAPQSTLTDFVFADGSLIASNQDGTLTSDRPYFGPDSFGSNNLLQVDDLAVNDNELLVASDNHLVSLGSDFFGLTSATAPQSLSFSAIANPYAGPTGVCALNDGRFAIWNTSGQSGSYRLMTPSSGLGPAIGNFPSPFSDLRDAGGELLALGSQGSVNLLNIDSGLSSFNYTAFGLQSVAYVNPQKIIAGRTQSGALNTALLQINPMTGETVPIPDSSIVVFDLAYDAANQVLYTLDIENASNGGTKTVLKAHQLSTLDRGKALLS